MANYLEWLKEQHHAMWEERVRLANEFAKLDKSDKYAMAVWNAFIMADDRQRGVMDEIRKLEGRDKG